LDKYKDGIVSRSSLILALKQHSDIQPILDQPALKLKIVGR